MVAGLREALLHARSATPEAPAARELLDELYAQIEYHFGWRDTQLRPGASRAGKLLRPTMLLLACDLAAGHAGASAAERTRAGAARGPGGGGGGAGA